MKILKELENGKYEIELEEKDLEMKEICARETQITIMHDYVKFKGSMCLTNPDGSVGPNVCAEVKIPVSSMILRLIQKLNSAPELKREQLKDSRYDRLDEVVIDGEWTYFKPAGEDEFISVKTSVYRKYIRPTLCDGQN